MFDIPGPPAQSILPNLNIRYDVPFDVSLAVIFIPFLYCLVAAFYVVQYLAICGILLRSIWWDSLDRDSRSSGNSLDLTTWLGCFMSTNQTQSRGTLHYRSHPPNNHPGGHFCFRPQNLYCANSCYNSSKHIGLP